MNYLAWPEQTLHLIGATLFLALTLLSYFFSTITVNQKQIETLLHSMALKINFFNIFLILIQILSGSLLVISKHYHFNTRWIDAAYLFAGTCLLILFYLIILLRQKKKTGLKKKQIWQLHLLHLMIIFIAIIIMHDAICKTSFL